MQKADAISSHMLTVISPPESKFFMSPIEDKDGGSNKNREGRKKVSFTASMSCAHCEQHSGLCTTEDIQHGMLKCPSGGYHTASLILHCMS